MHLPIINYCYLTSKQIGGAIQSAGEAPSRPCGEGYDNIGLRADTHSQRPFLEGRGVCGRRNWQDGAGGHLCIDTRAFVTLQERPRNYAKSRQRTFGM